MGIDSLIMALMNNEISMEEFMDRMFQSRGFASLPRGTLIEMKRLREMPSFKELMAMREKRYCDSCKLLIADAFDCQPVRMENGIPVFDPKGKKYCRECAMKEEIRRYKRCPQKIR